MHNVFIKTTWDGVTAIGTIDAPWNIFIACVIPGAFTFLNNRDAETVFLACHRDATPEEIREIALGRARIWEDAESLRHNHSLLAAERVTGRVGGAGEVFLGYLSTEPSISSAPPLTR